MQLIPGIPNAFFRDILNLRIRALFAQLTYTHTDLKLTYRLRRRPGLPDGPLPLAAASPVSIFSELLKNFRITAATFSFERDDIF